jgi:hypothetical protein
MGRSQVARGTAATSGDICAPLSPQAVPFAYVPPRTYMQVFYRARDGSSWGSNRGWKHLLLWLNPILANKHLHPPYFVLVNCASCNSSGDMNNATLILIRARSCIMSLGSLSFSSPVVQNSGVRLYFIAQQALKQLASLGPFLPSLRRFSWRLP